MLNAAENAEREAKVPSRPRRIAESGSLLAYASPEVLFRSEHESLVRALALAAGGDLEDARDAVQEAFVRLCLDWPRISRYEDPAAWVRRVALNRLRNQQRSRRRWRGALLRLGSHARERAAAGMAVTLGVQLADCEALRLLRRLPERQRVAMALHYVADLSVAQVAAAMGISEGSVKQHLFRARESLRAGSEVRQ